MNWNIPFMCYGIHVENSIPLNMIDYHFIPNKMFDSIIYMIGLFSSPNINTWKYIALSDNKYKSYYVHSTINKINITQNIKCMFCMLFHLIYTMKGEIGWNTSRASTHNITICLFSHPMAKENLPNFHSIANPPPEAFFLSLNSSLLYLSQSCAYYISRKFRIWTLLHSVMFILCAYI